MHLKRRLLINKKSVIRIYCFAEENASRQSVVYIGDLSLSSVPNHSYTPSIGNINHNIDICYDKVNDYYHIFCSDFKGKFEIFTLHGQLIKNQTINNDRIIVNSVNFGKFPIIFRFSGEKEQFSKL